MGACCCTEGTMARRFPGSMVQLSMISVSPGMNGEGTPGAPQTYMSVINEYTLEVAYQRSQGRRDHQEDFLSLLSLTTASNNQQRHDDFFGPPGPFRTKNDVNAGAHEADDDSLAGETFVPPEIHWIGVFDGHGGDRVSEFCASDLHEEFLWRFSKLGEMKDDSQTISRLFTETFLSFDEEIKLLQPRKVQQPTTHLNKNGPMSFMQSANTAGSTATVLTMHKMEDNDIMISVAHCGDSRMLMFTVENLPDGDIFGEDNVQDRSPGKAKGNGFFNMGRTSVQTWNAGQSFLPLTKKESSKVRKALRAKQGREWSRDVHVKRIYETMDHQPTEKSEALRVVKAGGQVINNRVNGVLAVSRALGDADQKLRNGLIANPDTFSVRLSELLKPSKIQQEEEISNRRSLRSVTSLREKEKEKEKEKENDNETEIEDKNMKEIMTPDRDVICVMASDGLWMYHSSDQVQGDVVEMLARGYTLQQITQVLMEKVITDERGIDNTAIVVLKLSKPGNPFNKNVGSVGSFGSYFDQNAIRESLQPDNSNKNKNKNNINKDKPIMEEQTVPKKDNKNNQDLTVVPKPEADGEIEHNEEQV